LCAESVFDEDFGDFEAFRVCFELDLDFVPHFYPLVYSSARLSINVLFIALLVKEHFSGELIGYVDITVIPRVICHK
jgi:hypothetical protein